MEDKSIGLIVIATIAILVGLAFWSQIGSNIGAMTKTYDSGTNFTFAVGNNGTAKELTGCGQEVVTITIYNGTTIVPSTNYTTSVANGVDGYRAAFITSLNSAYNGASWKVTCNYKPKGYVDDSATRGIVALIAVFAALLIVASASPNLKDWVKDQVR